MGNMARALRVAGCGVLALLCMSAVAATASETPEEAEARYAAAKEAFQVMLTPPGEAPGVSPAILAAAGDVSRFGTAWEATPPELWFPVGEISEYSVLWGVFTVGEAVARADWVEVAGRRLLTLTMEAESNGIVEALYPVKERMQTLLDPVTFLPLVFEKQSSEGRRKYHEVTTFDHVQKRGHYESLLRGDDREDFEISEDTRDLMGLMYWIRKSPVREGETRTYQVMTDEKLYELVVDAGRKESVKLEHYGKVPCIKMEPKGKFNGMFVRKGRMFLWVSDDARYTICRATASVPVASIKIMLEKVRGPGDDFWVTEANKKKR